MSKYFSLPLFKENLKRFWPFPAVGFILYFLSGPFSLITTEYEYWGSYTVKLAIGGENHFYFALDVVLACVAAVVVYSYLNKQNSVAAVHAMPFSRLSLYLTNYASGFALAVLPRLVNTLVLLAVKKEFVISQGVNIFTAAAVLKVFGLGLVVILFTYALSVLAAMVSGNSVIAMLTAPTVNFIFPLFIASLTSYGESYLYGFSYGSVVEDIAAKLMPAIIFFDDNYVSICAGGARALPGLCVSYIIAAIAVSVLSFFFYKKRRLERAGDAYVFDVIKYIVCFFFVYFAGTMFGLIFSELKIGFGMIIGIIVGFAIGWMIANKSFKIFNLKALKALGIYAVIMLAIVGIFKFDLTGYSKRTPAAENVEKVYIDSNISNYYYVSDLTDATSFSDAENIKHAAAMQKDIAAHKGDFSEYGDGYYSSYINISYQLKNGRIMRRIYYGIPMSYLKDSEDLKAVYESNEFRSRFDMIKEISPRRIDIVNSWSGDSVFLSNADEMNELLDKLYYDTQNLKYEDMVYDTDNFIELIIQDRKKAGDSDDYLTYTFNVNKNNKAVYGWLAEKGYLDELMNFDNGFIVLTKDSESYDVMYGTISKSADNGYIPESQAGMYVITDSSTIHEIAKNVTYVRYGSPADDNSLWGVYYHSDGIKSADGIHSTLSYYDSRYFTIRLSDLPEEITIDLKNYIQ